MDCPQVNEHLPEYLSGTLEPPARLEIEDHLTACSRCRTEAGELDELWSDLDTIRPAAPSAEARVRFDAMLQAFSAGRASNETTGIGAGRWWPRRPGGHVAAAVMLLAAGTIMGFALQPPAGPSSAAGSLVSLEQEVRTLQQLVALSMLDQRSASQRLQGVGWSSLIDQPDEHVLSTLIDTLNFDPNINVRLAVVGVLGQFADTPVVREGIVQSLPMQQSPMIQVALIDLLVRLHDQRSADIFERLVADDMVDATVRERAAWGLDQLG